MTKPVRLVVAQSSTGIIGNGDTIPWKLKDDMKFFKDLTSGGVVIMGRKTFESLGRKPLPNRWNIVVTRDPYKTSVEYIENAEKVDINISVVSSLEEAIEEAKNVVTLMEPYEGSINIIGGAQIYVDALEKDLVDEVYVTFIQDDGEIEGDVKFSPIPYTRGEWIGATILTQNPDERNQYGFHIEKWKQMKKPR